MSQLVLEVRSVVKVLGGSRVLRGVVADFQSGRPHVVEGANGSGKSTLMGVLAGRSRVTSGAVRLQREGVVLAQGPDLRAHIGWLGHDLGLYADLTSRENLALHAQVRGVRLEDAWERWAAPLRLEPLADRRVRELSRGQRQRVALARALVGQPAVLLLDEPSTGLDGPAVDQLAGVLRDLSDAGTLVLAITHDVPFRDRLGGTLWRLSQGLLTSEATASAS